MYTPRTDADEWWWQPLPPFVTDNLSMSEIEYICTLSDEELVTYHNTHIDDSFDVNNTCLRAKMWVAQGECWRRGFKCACIKARIT